MGLSWDKFTKCGFDNIYMIQLIDNNGIDSDTNDIVYDGTNSLNGIDNGIDTADKAITI